MKIFGFFLLIKKKKIGFFKFFHEELPSGEEANKAEDRQYVSSLLKRGAPSKKGRLSEAAKEYRPTAFRQLAAKSKAAISHPESSPVKADIWVYFRNNEIVGFWKFRESVVEFLIRDWRTGFLRVFITTILEGFQDLDD